MNGDTESILFIIIAMLKIDTMVYGYRGLKKKNTICLLKFIKLLRFYIFIDIILILITQYYVLIIQLILNCILIMRAKQIRLLLLGKINYIYNDNIKH